ncbi:MAG: hypothetical protein AB8G95_11565 [Anaerolineae bacterium]
MSNKEFESDVRSLEFKFKNLNDRYDLSGSETAVEKIKHGIRAYPDQLAELERRGFLHTLPLKKVVEAVAHDWSNGQEKEVLAEIQSLKKRLMRERSKVNAQMRRLDKPSAAIVKSAETAVEAFDDVVGDAESKLRTMISKTTAEVDQVAYQMRRVEWMLDQLDEAADIMMLENEGPLLAVEAEWENDGDEGPDGVLYLTDQRLIFEEKAEKATKKFLFITRESELVQELLISEPVSEIQEVSYSEERRRRIQLRKDDIIELVMSGNAAHSRLRFHISGQESKDWAVMINRVMDGDVFKDRAESAQSDEANVRDKSFPADCPGCFAPIPPQPRGALSVTCEFCNATVQAV